MASVRQKVLIVDADQGRGRNVKSVLDFMNRHDTVLRGPRECQAELDDSIEAVFIERSLPVDSLKEVTLQALDTDPDLAIVILDSDGEKRDMEPEIESRVFCHLPVPIRFPQLNSTLDKIRAHRESRQTTQGGRPIELYRNLVGKSHAVRRVHELIRQAGPSGATVLITGESGTGKEVVARNLHYVSNRRGQPFVPVNCGAIPEDLLESELFGHEKGAFTGAISARKGRFEMAQGGTLFLDEIGDMPLAMQVKLLRVLQERTYERVGGSKSIRADVRVVTATHRNLEERIKEDLFREDLYYRLNVFPIEMPSLRERSEDIPLLVDELGLRVEHERGTSVQITERAMRSLQLAPWPGNVRELANLVERLAVLYPDQLVDVEQMPHAYRYQAGTEPAEPEEGVSNGVADLPPDGINLKEYVNGIELALIRQALEASNGVVAHAAELLSMRRTTLAEKIRKHGFNADSKQ